MAKSKSKSKSRPATKIKNTQPRDISRWFPVINTVRSYRRNWRTWLPKDIVAGVTLASILIPMDMAYAEVAGLPGIYGLYASVVALLVYAIFGPNRILVLGPESAVVALMAAIIVPLGGNDPGRAAALAGTLAILTGLLCILTGVLRFGFITDLLSKPIRLGLLNGIAVTLAIGQIPKFLGFKVKGLSVLAKGEEIVRAITGGNINWTACVIGGASLVAILAVNRFFPRIPGVLVAVVGATAAAAILDLSTKAGIAVLGPLPRGLPGFHVPALSANDMRVIVPGAFALAVVAFADMSVLSRTFAARGGYRVDSSQDLVALGIANVLCGLFRGFTVSACASRTPVAAAAGAKSQLTGVVSVLCITILLIAAPKLLTTLPEAALGAIVISACIELAEIFEVKRLFRVRRSEFILSIICFLGVVLMGIMQGIFIAVALSLLVFIWRAWHPYDAVLGRLYGVEGYHDTSRHPSARLIPGLVLFRWDAPLFFPNADIFHDRVLQAISEAPDQTKCVIVAAEPVTDVDTTAADVLANLDRELQRVHIKLCFAEVKDPVQDKLKTYGIFTQVGAELFFPTVANGVDWYLETYQVNRPFSSDPDKPPVEPSASRSSSRRRKTSTKTVSKTKKAAASEKGERAASTARSSSRRPAKRTKAVSKPKKKAASGQAASTGRSSSRRATKKAKPASKGKRAADKATKTRTA